MVRNGPHVLKTWYSVSKTLPVAVTWGLRARHRAGFARAKEQVLDRLGNVRPAPCLFVRGSVRARDARAGSNGFLTWFCAYPAARADDQSGRRAKTVSVPSQPSRAEMVLSLKVCFEDISPAHPALRH